MNPSSPDSPSAGGARWPKTHFDTGKPGPQVTFDDGDLRRTFPWSHLHETRWARSTPDLLQVEIGEWLVELRGHNLGALFSAIQGQRLQSVRAQPEFAEQAEHDIDSFVTLIEWTRLKARAASARALPKTAQAIESAGSLLPPSET
jgi:hypothetical protein